MIYYLWWYDVANPSIGGGLNARGVAKYSYSNFGLIEGISRKRCKVEGKLLLITNRKSYMSFRLLPKSVTLNDVMALFCVISANSVAFGEHCIKVHVRRLISWWVLVLSTEVDEIAEMGSRVRGFSLGIQSSQEQLQKIRFVKQKWVKMNVLKVVLSIL